MINSPLIFRSPIVAHRGASASAPENTLASLMLAREQKASWIEVDVKITSDGMPILMHDDTLDRTTSGKGKVADKNWADIKTLDAGAWFGARFKGERIPTLAEVLRFAIDSDMQINLEIKPCPGRAKATTMVSLIEATKWWPHDREPPLLSSFSEEALASAKQLQPHWPRSFAFEKWQDDWRAAAARLEVQAVTVDASLLNTENIRILKRLGLAILAFTVNDPLRAKEFLAQGVDAIVCNNPGEMLKAL